MTEQEANCKIKREIKNTKLTCGGTGEDKCKECDRQEPALKDMYGNKEEQKNNGWTPVSERLPDVSVYYLVTRKNSTTPEYAWFISSIKKWEYLGCDTLMNDVVAWMPLPERFKK